MEQAKEFLASPEVKQTAAQCAYMTAAYPLDFARTLMQLGYEPFPPTERTFITGSQYLALPNTFQYLKYIKSVDGFFGCYRGLAPRLCQTLVAQCVHKRIDSKNPYRKCRTDREAETGEELRLSSARSGALVRGSQAAQDFLTVVKSTGYEIFAVTCSIIASQPFYVISVRTMAQFVGREVKYNSILGSIRTIFQEDGLFGFFSGLFPRLLGEAIFITMSASLVYVIRTYVGVEERGTVEACSLMMANVVSSSFTYQFLIVSSMMAVNDAQLAIGRFPFTPRFDDWYECWRSLANSKQLKRGSSIIGRYYTGPTIVMNGKKRPTGFYFGPLHPPGLGAKEAKVTAMYPYVPKPPMA